MTLSQIIAALILSAASLALAVHLAPRGPCEKQRVYIAGMLVGERCK